MAVTKIRRVESDPVVIDLTFFSVLDKAGKRNASGLKCEFKSLFTAVLCSRKPGLILTRLGNDRDDRASLKRGMDTSWNRRERRHDVQFRIESPHHR